MENIDTSSTIQNIENFSDDLSSKQEIYQQIDEDILSHRQFQQSIKQKTKSNYKFIIMLDIFALIVALIGGGVVYHLFKEQQIQLVAGQGAVKVLEFTLLDELNKQYQQDLLEKDNEITSLRGQIANIEEQMRNKILKLEEENKLELERQKELLTIQMQKGLEGKTDQEKEQIVQQYNEQIIQLENKLKKEQEVVRSQMDNELQELIQKQQEQLQNQLNQQKSIQKTLDQQEQRIVKIQTLSENKKSVINPEQLLQRQMLETSIILDRKISELFLDIQAQLQQSNCIAVSNILFQIKTLYTDNVQNLISQERRSADLFLIEVIREYINTQEKNTSLTSQILMQEKSLEELRIRLEQGISSKDSTFVVLKEQLITFSKMINGKSSTRTINKQLKIIKTSMPEVLIFLESYERYQKNDFSYKADKLIQKAETLVNKEKYREAIDIYQQILRVYPGIRQQEDVVRQLYDTIVLELNKEGNTALVSDRNLVSPDSFNDIPNNLNNNVQKILKNSRYTTPNYKIVYMYNPDGYIVDIINNNVIVSLIAGKVVSKNQELFIYRVVDSEKFQMDVIGVIKSTANGKGNIQAEQENNNMKIGDLVYLNFPIN